MKENPLLAERLARNPFVPKLFVCLAEGYGREAFIRDSLAGLVVGIVALPLALAFAIGSGVDPVRGLYTAIVAGFIVSFLGGSRVQIGGPTGAFVVIVYGIVQKYGTQGLVACTVIAGVMVLALGLARLGTLIKFIPYPVITGFTSGIALIILSGQVKDFLGLKMGAVPPEFVEKWEAYGKHISSFNPAALGVGLGTLLVVLLWPRVTKKIPSPFVAMALATLAVAIFQLPVETIGSRFGSVPSGIPVPHDPGIGLKELRELVSPAFTIALLAAIESLLSAVVADGMIGSRHKSNMELVAQGLANIASGLFGGIPATGALARTATNIKSGGRTPIAGMVHAVTLLLILLFFGRWAAMIPLAALAAILVVVAYNMSEWRSFRALLLAPKGDIAVLVLTFLLTIFVDLTVAVQVGVVMSSLLFMQRMAEVTDVVGVTDDLRGRSAKEDSKEFLAVHDRVQTLGRDAVPKGVEVFEVQGPFFFGAADKLKHVLDQLDDVPKVFVLRMRYVPTVDATGVNRLRQVANQLRSQGTEILIAELPPEPRHTLLRVDRLTYFPRWRFARSMPEAFEKARQVMSGELPPQGAPAPDKGDEE